MKEKNDTKKELEYFRIGRSYGGNQNWMIDPWMHIGGCAALTTCDLFIYMAMYKGRSELCPFDVSELTKKEYRKFGMLMKSYLQPRETGIKDLDTYIRGGEIDIEDSFADDIVLEGVPGTVECGRAAELIRSQIDSGMPVPYLMLKNRHREFDFFEWHWFIVNGYEIRDSRFYIKTATYGKADWLDFEKLWDTGFDEKGGFVLVKAKNA